MDSRRLCNTQTHGTYLVVESGLAAFFVNYTPPPEAKYPKAINEIYVDGSQLAIVGNSVDANMANTVNLLAKKNKEQFTKLQVLLWPVTNTDFDTNFYKMYSEQRFLTTSMMKWMFDQYSTKPKQRSGIYFSPLLASLEDLASLPPTIIQVAEMTSFGMRVKL